MKSRYLVLIFGLVFLRILLFPIANSDYQLVLGQHQFKAIICEEPKRSFHKQELILCSSLVSSRILVQTETFPRYGLYQKLELSCNLQEPENFSDFDYKNYLAKQGIHLLCFYPRVLSIQDSGINDAKYLSWKIKENIARRIDRHLLEPGAGLAKAMLLGYRSEIAEELERGMIKAGLAHILAISGLHISIFIGLLLWLFKKLRFKWLIISVILLFYLFILGFPISAIRAVIMSLLLFTGRSWASLRVRFLLALAITLLIYPRAFQEVGFQMSFLAVAGLIWIYPLLDNWSYRVFGYWSLRLRMSKMVPFDFSLEQHKSFKFIIQGCLASLSVNIVLWPLLSYYFSGYNILSVVINVLALPVLPLLLSGLYMSVIVPVIFYACYWPLQYFQLLSQIYVGYFESGHKE